jgi:type VI secretion system secreted protein VgrG
MSGRAFGAVCDIAVRECDADLVALSLETHETVGKPARALVHCLAYRNGAIVAATGLDLVGKRATVTLSDGSGKRLVGVVSEIHDEAARSSLLIESPIAALAHCVSYRVWVDRTSLAAAEQLLAHHGLTAQSALAHVDRKRPLDKHPQYLQAFESDLDFLTRVLSFDGLCWFCRSDEPDVVHIAGDPGSFADARITLHWREASGTASGQAAHRLRLERARATDRVAVARYDFERPTVDISGAAGEGALERYRVARGFSDRASADELARMRLDAEDRGTVLVGEATEHALAPGTIIEVAGAPSDAMNGKWLVIASELYAGASQHEESELRFRAVRADAGYRPAPPRPIDRGGLARATVTGAASQEIGVDRHARIRARMAWDRQGKDDDGASSPVRTLQPHLSGAVFHPRIGWEQAVAFADPAGEEPIMLGRLYHAAAPPPASLPARMVETHFGTLSTQRGTQGNFIRFDDTAGVEKLSMQASRDYREQTDKDKLVAVGREERRSVGGERKLVVKEELQSSVRGGHEVKVRASRTVTIGHNHHLRAASETITVGAARALHTGGDLVVQAPYVVRLVGLDKTIVPLEHESLFAQGGSGFIVGGSLDQWSAFYQETSVALSSFVKISGPQAVSCDSWSQTIQGLWRQQYRAQEIHADGNVSFEFGKSQLTIRGDVSLTSDAVVFEAESQLTIKADGLTIEMTPTSIEVRGDFQSSTSSVEEGKHRYG